MTQTYAARKNWFTSTDYMLKTTGMPGHSQTLFCQSYHVLVTLTDTTLRQANPSSNAKTTSQPPVLKQKIYKLSFELVIIVKLNDSNCPAKPLIDDVISSASVRENLSIRAVQ
jgi:hypothetical protein